MSRMVGYQGLSSRANSQRQSGAAGNASQVGRPNAAARWAGRIAADHQVEIRHQRGRFVKVGELIGQVDDRRSTVESRRPFAPRVFLQAIKTAPWHFQQRHKTLERNRTECIFVVIAVAAQNRPTRSSRSLANRLRQRSTSAGSAERYAVSAGIVSNVV